MEKVGEICQGNNPEMPFYIPYNLYEKYSCFPRTNNQLISFADKYYLITQRVVNEKGAAKDFTITKGSVKIIDQETGLLLKEFETHHLLISSNNKLISIDAKSIKYLSLEGDLKFEVELDEKYKHFSWCLNQNNQLCCLDEKRKLIFVQKKSF